MPKPTHPQGSTGKHWVDDQSHQDRPSALRQRLPWGRYWSDDRLKADEEKLGLLHTICLEGPITDASMLLLASLDLANLRELHLIDTRNISDRGIAMIEGLTQLRWLNIDTASLSNVSLVCIRNLDNLVGLHLTGTKINDNGLWKLGRMKQLEYLNLQRSLITDSGLTHLGKMNNLKSLRLDYTLVSDNGLFRLTGLKNLSSLSLFKTKVTKDGASWLRLLLPKCALDIESPSREWLDNGHW